MSGEPTIIRQWAQSGAGERRAKARFLREKAEQKAQEKDAKRKEREAGLPRRAVHPGQEIGFYGATDDGSWRAFMVLAGEGAPTVTGGWSKVATIDRAGRVGYTIPTGYDPIVMRVPILFDNVIKMKEPGDIENDILALEWMAGRDPNPKGGEVKGEPPYVEVFTIDSFGRTIPLVPKQFQSEGKREKLWYITNIEFDENPIRDEGGGRRRQAAVVTLIEVVATTGEQTAAAKAKAKVKGYKKFRTTSVCDTIKKVAIQEHVPKKWQEILEANRKLGASGEKPLKPGTLVLIPRDVFRRVPK